MGVEKEVESGLHATFKLQNSSEIIWYLKTFFETKLTYRISTLVLLNCRFHQY